MGILLTRGQSLQDSLREIITKFAFSRGINNLEAVTPYYTPTRRPQDKILQMAAAKGSFGEGWAHAFVMDKFGEATTHWRKLEERVQRGVGSPCPLLLIGIPKEIIVGI